MVEFLQRLKDYASSFVAPGVNPRDKWSLLWQQTKNLRVRCKLDTHNPQAVSTLRTIYGPLSFRDHCDDITNRGDLHGQ